MEYFYGAHSHAIDTSTQCWYTKLMPHRGPSTNLQNGGHPSEKCQVVSSDSAKNTCIKHV